MKTFPMFLQMAGRRVVIVGGDEQAAQKARLILKTEAEIAILAPKLEEELFDLVSIGRIQHLSGPITPHSFENSALSFIATGCPGADMALHALAKEGGATVNVVDQPDLCDAITPSIVDRDPVVVAIGTEGTAPVLARQIKTKVEEILEPKLGELAALAGRLRTSAAMRLSPRKRRDLWRWVFNSLPRREFSTGKEREAARLIKTAIKTGVFPGQEAGSVCLVNAGPGEKDLITLRAVQRLQEADIIFYDGSVEPDVLELARRDAERVHVRTTSGSQTWPKEKVLNTILAEAKNGKRAVWLFGDDATGTVRSIDDIRASETEDLPIEFVPGVGFSDIAVINGIQGRSIQRVKHA